MKNLRLFVGLALLVAGYPVQAGGEKYSTQAYAEVLKKHVAPDGRVDYKALHSDRSGLDAYVQSLGKLSRLEFDRWPEADRLALLMNAYNAFTLQLIIDHYPIQSSFWTSLRFPKNSIRQISGAWDEIQFQLMGSPITLGDIEHQVLRKNYSEPRLHMAINCASVGCPPLRNEPFLANRLNDQLADQTRRFLADPSKFQIDRQKRVVRLSSIFQWFGEDFVAGYVPPDGYTGQSRVNQAVLAFIAQHLSDEDAGYLKTGRYSVSFLEYDWSLNEVAR